MFFDPPPEVSISATVMYAPWIDWRVDNAERLYGILSDSDCIDEAFLYPVERIPPYDNSLHCWEQGLDAGGTHHLVVQGDADLCDGFGEALRNALRMVPNRIVQLFAVWDSIWDAWERNVPWLRHSGYPWGLAVVLPTNRINSYLDWADTFVPEDNTAADYPIGCWNSLENDSDVWCTVPSLVEHLGVDDSSMNNNPPIERTAQIFADAVDVSPPEIDWNCDVSSVPEHGRNIRYDCLDWVDIDDGDSET